MSECNAPRSLALPALDTLPHSRYKPGPNLYAKEFIMRRVAAIALILCACCVGCENTPFYHEPTASWFGPFAEKQPLPPGVEKPPANPDGLGK